MVCKGIIPPVVTPLRNNKELDERGLVRLIEHLLDAGVHGLFMLGTTGEGVSLNHNLRAELVKRTCSIVNNHIPVIAAITDTSIEDSVRLAEIYKDAGASMVVVAPPFYNPINQEQFIHYLSVLVPRLQLPFLLYHIPSHTKMHLTMETVQFAMELGASGIKDSSGDIYNILSLIDGFKNHPEFAVLSGSEVLIPETILCGGHGAVPGGANVFPDLYVNLYHAAINMEYEKIDYYKKIVIEINNTLYHFGPYPSGIILGIKSALSLMNICNDYSIPPLQKHNDKIKLQIKNFLVELQNKN